MFASQNSLSSQIDALTIELNRLSQASELPVLTVYARKLNESRRRVGSINATLGAIAERLDRLHASIPDEVKQRRAAAVAGPARAESAGEAASGEAGPKADASADANAHANATDANASAQADAQADAQAEASPAGANDAGTA